MPEQDPWATEAASMQKSLPAQGAAAPKGDSDLVKLWGQHDRAGGHNVADPGLGTLSDTVKEGVAGLKNLVAGPYHAFADERRPDEDAFQNPVERGLKRMFIDPSVQEWNTPSQKGVMIGGTGHPTADKVLRSLPLVGPMTANVDRINQEEGFAPAAASILAPFAVGEGVAALPKVGRYLRPSSSSSIVDPAEMASRRLSSAVLPATKDASSFIKAAPLEVPNVLDYAKRTGNPLNTQLEFAKAAQGSAKEARSFYEDQVLKPNDKLVKTSGTGFGDRSGEGPDTYAKLSEIDKRIVEINKQLDKPTLNVDDQRRALASKSDLQNEARGLTKILHEHLANATGLQPEDIANLRQRVGRSYEIGNDTEAAVTGRMQGEGQAKLGPVKLFDLPGRVLTELRGGPTAIADRQFQRAIRRFPGEPQALPTLKPIVPAMDTGAEDLIRNIRNSRMKQ